MPPVLPGPYFHDVLAQPAALASTLDALGQAPDLRGVRERLTRGELRRIVLTGMGASFIALQPFHLTLVQAGLNAVLVEMSELVHHQPGWLTPDSLLVVVSQSGASAELIPLLERRPRQAPLIGLTNTPGSLLGRHSDFTIPLAAGSEASVSSKTYVATLAALVWLADALHPAHGRWPGHAAQLRQALPLLAAYLEAWPAHVAALGSLFRRERRTFFLGRGPSLAAAEAGGLMTKEATGCTAEGLGCAAFRHGPFELLGSDLQAVVFAGVPPTVELNRRLCRDMQAAGAPAFWCGPDAAEPVFRLPPVTPVALPLAEILPVQMIALTLAALDGREAGRFTRASKITATE